MNTKIILQILGKTILSLVIVCAIIFGVGIIMYGSQQGKFIGEFFSALPFVLPYLFSTLIGFYFMDQRMILKRKTNKIFPYFLYTIGIPTIMAMIAVTIAVMIRSASMQFVNAYLVILLNTIIAVAITVFFSVFHYLKHNTKNQKHNLEKGRWNKITMLKSVLLYAFILAIMDMLVNMILFRFVTNEYIISAIIRGMIIAIICWFLILFFNKKLNTKLSFPATVITSIIAIVLLMQIILPLQNFIETVIFNNYFVETYLNGFTLIEMLKSNALTSVYVIFCVLFYQFLYFNETRSLEQKSFKAEIGKQTEKYESLRRQLSPHFLFNNINVLTALIEENPQKAVRFSESLGNIYRHFLRQEDEDVVSLESALSFSKDYLELLQYRYEDAFQYIVPETVDSNYFIIPLALQQVIENTIKHNEVSKEMPLQVIIGIQDDYLIVQNTKQLKTLTEVSKGTGIENIKSRYAFLTEKEVIIEDAANSFTIKLPLLNMENS